MLGGFSLRRDSGLQKGTSWVRAIAQVRRAGGQQPSKHCCAALLCKGRCKGECQKRRTQAKKFFANRFASWPLCQPTCAAHVLKNVAALFMLFQKTQEKSQLNKLFISNDSFVAISFSAVQHIIGTYFHRQKGKNKTVNYSSQRGDLVFPML